MSNSDFTIGDRVARAEAYFTAKHNLRGQRKWYDRKASRSKSWHIWLGFTVLAAGALTAVIQLWAPTPPDAPFHWVPFLTAVLGATVVIAKGADRIWGFDENWVGYRQAAEAMKSERRLYVNGAGEYAGLTDEDAAYRLFVENLEEIIATEQHSFWRRATEKKDEAAGEKEKS